MHYLVGQHLFHYFFLLFKWTFGSVSPYLLLIDKSRSANSSGLDSNSASGMTWCMISKKTYFTWLISNKRFAQVFISSMLKGDVGKRDDVLAVSNAQFRIAGSITANSSYWFPLDTLLKSSLAITKSQVSTSERRSQYTHSTSFYLVNHLSQFKNLVFISTHSFSSSTFTS